jgi:hypothetical protein
VYGTIVLETCTHQTQGHDWSLKLESAFLFIGFFVLN